MPLKLFLLDPYNVRYFRDAELRQCTPEKTVTSAVWTDQYAWSEFTGIPEWEQRVSILYPTAEYDEKSRKYRIWYYAQRVNSPLEDRRWTEQLIDRNDSLNVELDGAENTARGTVRPGKDILCCMESRDGKNWERPELGEFLFRTREGRITGTNIVSVGMHGTGVRRNENPDPGEPAYLMAGRTWETDSLDSSGEPIGAAVSWSDDGIHWEEPVTVKTAYDCMPDISNVRADTHNQLFWSPERGRYAVITRGYSAKSPSVRLVVYMESSPELRSIRDLARIKAEAGDRYWSHTSSYWSRPETVLDRDVSLCAQPYSMPFARVAEGCHIGLVSIADFDRKTKGVFNSVHAELTWSRDAKDWHYLKRGEPFIPNAERFELRPGNDYGMIYGAAPVTAGERSVFFYAAIPELHYFGYGDVPGNIREAVGLSIPEAAKAKAVTRSTALCAAVLGKDRYAGYYAENGSVTLAPVRLTGGRTEITADTDKGGSVSVGVLDGEGRPVPGFTCEDCDTVREDVTDGALTWRGNDLSRFTGRTVSFMIRLKKATVFTVGGDIGHVRKEAGPGSF